MYKLTTGNLIHDLEGDVLFPQDTASVYYAAYLAWVEAGNTPEPADVPDPKAAIRAQIEALEAQQLLPRITREFMLATAQAQAQAAGVDPMQNVGYAKLKQFDELIASLRDKL